MDKKITIHDEEYKTLTPTAKLGMLVHAVLDDDWDTYEFINKDLGLDKVPYSEGD